MTVWLRNYALPLCLATGCVLTAGCRSETDRPQATANYSVPVKTVAVMQSEVARTSRQPATLLAYYETEIRAKVFGYATEVAADIGDVVQAGQSLAVIDVPELSTRQQTMEARIDLLVAGEQAAQAGVNLADAAVRSAQARLEQSRAELAKVEASLAAAEAEFKRTEDLVNRGSLQNRVLDEVRKRRDSEDAARQAVLSAAVAAEAEVAVADSQKAAALARMLTAEAETRVARSELKELQVDLSFANIRAPFSGVITERHLNLGDLVEGSSGTGSKPLFVIHQVDKLRVHVPVPEIDAPFVEAGDVLILSFPSFRSEPPISASVTRRAASLDPSTRTMMVEAEIDNSDGRLLPGMFGEALLELNAKSVASVLPSRAVRFDESGRAYVYLVDSSNRVRLAEVTAGRDTGAVIEILSGVEPGDTVIGPHLQRFTDGQEVRPL
ncbi:MAG: efflux RND transporter periplasmic adaptor subunit [bacterium]|nr:efflux RND transporter periplasmic adaptor subunit [bacterium]